MDYFFTAKRAFTDPDSEAVISVTVPSVLVPAHTDPANGTTVVPISNIQSNQDPGTYYYDFQWKDAGGKIRTFLRGKLKIVDQVTQRTS